jgi:hypothetical protein
MVYVIKPGEKLYDARWDDDELLKGLEPQDYERGTAFQNTLAQLQSTIKNGLVGAVGDFTIDLKGRGVLVAIPSNPIERTIQPVAFSERVVRPVVDAADQPVPMVWLEVLMPRSDRDGITIHGVSPQYDDESNYHFHEEYRFDPSQHRLAIYLRRDWKPGLRD